MALLQHPYIIGIGIERIHVGVLRSACPHRYIGRYLGEVLYLLGSTYVVP